MASRKRSKTTYLDLDAKELAPIKRFLQRHNVELQDLIDDSHLVIWQDRRGYWIIEVPSGEDLHDKPFETYEDALRGLARLLRERYREDFGE